MKKLHFTLIAISLLLFSFSSIKAQTFQVTVKNSTIQWKGFKPTGSHYGTIALSKGFFTLENNKIVGGEFTIDMNSIIDLDMPADDKYNAQLVNHLKSVNFFDTNKYPTGSFKITSSETKGDKILIKGNLTLKNKTNPVSFLATVKYKNDQLIFKSDTFKIDRSKWDIRYKSKSFCDDLKDKFIYDDMEITIEIEANK